MRLVSILRKCGQDWSNKRYSWQYRLITEQELNIKNNWIQAGWENFVEFEDTKLNIRHLGIIKKNLDALTKQLSSNEMQQFVKLILD